MKTNTVETLIRKNHQLRSEICRLNKLVDQLRGDRDELDHIANLVTRLSGKLTGRANDLSDQVAKVVISPAFEE